MNFRGISIMAAAAAMLSCASGIYKTDTIGIEVSPQENREYSYTDKKAGYWYGRTHMESLDWYSGWNMAKKRVLADYTLSVDGKPLNRKEAEVTVYPDRLELRFMKINAYVSYERESPDMALANLIALASDFNKGTSVWTYEGEAADDEFFAGAMQEYCYTFHFCHCEPQRGVAIRPLNSYLSHNFVGAIHESPARKCL